ncbi:ABC transporter ATP-binding protein [Candidatus Dependentiae bacterium]|nr:ABC transporter ATP-binding protein [Candidatus Dependentiae bacterium]
MPYKPALLKISDLHKTFTLGSEKTVILQCATYTFKQNCSYSLIGVSGSGKSTLLHLLAGIEKPDSGSILFNDQDLSHFSSSEKSLFLQKNIGLIFQTPCLINELSVIENTMIKGLILGKKYSLTLEKSLFLLEKVGMAHKKDSFPATLSGGEQQRVAIARALFSEPAFIIADEPTAHLDKNAKQMIIELLLLCQQQWSTGLIIASHDDSVADAMKISLTLEKGLLHERKITDGS